jgi:predicted RNase H-like HicB family nuclease
MARRYYRAIAFQDPGDGPDDGWGVIFPDVPGCVSQGDTAQGAIENAIEALTLHLEEMAAQGQELPPPSRLNANLPRWVNDISKAANDVHALVPIDEPGRSIRVNITMDEALIGRVDVAAAQEGMTRSGFLAEAVRQKLGRPVSRRSRAGSPRRHHQGRRTK